MLTACDSRETTAAPFVTEQEHEYGAEQHPLLLAEFGGAYQANQGPYLAQLGERMARAAGLEGQCTFTLVNSDVVNAFAVPGCYIYVTRGLFAVVGSEAELASVLGHELGHIVARHSQQQQRRSLWRSLGVIAASLTGSEKLTRLAGQAAQYFTLRYSRKQEYQADELGIRYMQTAGYDPYAASDMLSALARQEQFMRATHGRDAARAIPEWALSHPLTEHRVDRDRQLATSTGLKDDQLPENSQAYLREVDGLLYGDDPQQGFVLGRRFAHPIMRISFEAPEGFSLTNSPAAIRLSGPDGLAGEFGGGELPPEGLQRYVELLAAHLLGETPSRISASQLTSINGLPAIVVRAEVAVQGGTLPLYLAAYDGGQGRAYHFVIISRANNDTEEPVLQLFNSFRRLSADEAARLRPRAIKIVQIANAVTGETILKDMADGSPRELFELLNGRPASAPLKPGTLIKTAAYVAPATATDH